MPGSAHHVEHSRARHWDEPVVVTLVGAQMAAQPQDPNQTQGLLGPGRPRVLPPGVNTSSWVLHRSSRVGTCDPNLPITVWVCAVWLIVSNAVTGRLSSGQITYMCFQEFPCSPLHWNQDLTISPEVSAAQLLQPWQVPDNQKNDTAKGKKVVCFHYPSRIKWKSKRTA